jgi:hypothetical protein
VFPLSVTTGAGELSSTPTIQASLPFSKLPFVRRFPDPTIKDTLSIFTSPTSPPISNKTLASPAPKPIDE